MSAAVQLMQAILGGNSQEAEAALLEAMVAEVDPLHWCAVHAGIQPEEMMRRAATWADLGFLDQLPMHGTLRLPGPPRPDRLAEIRMLRWAGLTAELTLTAPDFFEIVRLKDRWSGDRQGRPLLVPHRALRTRLVSALGETLLETARHSTILRWPLAAAQADLTLPARLVFAFGLLCLTGLVLLAPILGNPWLIPLWILAMAPPTLLRLAALATPLATEVVGPQTDPAQLPLYSILVPLRDEANMVEQLCASFRRLDYPAEKLQIIFVVEDRSPQTIAAVRRHLGDARFSLIVVPDAAPRTKPKALNFALPFCQGEFVVVYDAEDRPSPDQLRRIVGQFRRRPDVECIQARLLIDNGDAGPLPALFTGEYAGLFAVILPALASWGAYMPLGGTSNHFRLARLRELGGWDAYNVTEDADLGLRLARRTLRTATSTTFTREEAPVRLRPWLGQRSRWLKGWMQTFMVHNRRPALLLADLGWSRFILFELTILAMMAAPLLHLAFLPVFFWMWLGGQSGFYIADGWGAACLAMLVLGFGSTIATNLVGLARTGQRRFQLVQALLPIYWLLVGWACLLALRDFVRRPFHWFKSPHLATTASPKGSLSAVSTPMPAE